MTDDAAALARLDERVDRLARVETAAVEWHVFLTAAERVRPELVDAINAALDADVPIAAIARAARVSRPTIYAWRNGETD